MPGPARSLVILLLSACACSVAAPEGPQEAPTQPPNLLFFFADDQRHDTLGCAGHPILQTPAIDALAERGVRFTNMFVSHSICWVSRASILTGLTARSFGSPEQPDRVRAELLPLLYPELLQAAGYRTGHIGKYHARMPPGYRPDEAFDTFVPIHRDPYFKEQPDGSRRHTTDLITDRAVAFLRGSRRGNASPSTCGSTPATPRTATTARAPAISRGRPPPTGSTMGSSCPRRGCQRRRSSPASQTS